LHYYSGLSRFLKKEYTRAITDFNNALSLDPHDVGAIYYRGMCFEKTGPKLAHMIVFFRGAALGEQVPEGKGAFWEKERLHLNTELILLRFFYEGRITK
jgi:hypothetical protein